MRLEYYEFFSKFFNGGGLRFQPLTVQPSWKNNTLRFFREKGPPQHDRETQHPSIKDIELRRNKMVLFAAVLVGLVPMIPAVIFFLRERKTGPPAPRAVC